MTSHHMTYLLVAALPLYPHPPWVGAELSGPFMASGGAALAGGAVAPPHPSMQAAVVIY